MECLPAKNEEPSKRVVVLYGGKYPHRVKYNKYITCNIYHKHFNVTKLIFYNKI